VVAACVAGIFLAESAPAQIGGPAAPGSAVPKPAAPNAAANAKAEGEQPKPEPKLEGQFGQWGLLCSQPKTKDEKPICSLVQALVERDSQKLVFRVTVAYGPKGNLLLKIDSPTGVALQRGLEFSPGEVKIYRLPFQTCVPRGCSAVLLMEDDLKQDLQKAEKGTITVYAVSGQAVRALAELKGFGDGLAALDKRRAKP
jgi:invasion protein IalB